jgi:hypothetical protein
MNPLVQEQVSRDEPPLLCFRSPKSIPIGNPLKSFEDPVSIRMASGFRVFHITEIWVCLKIGEPPIPINYHLSLLLYGHWEVYPIFGHPNIISSWFYIKLYTIYIPLNPIDWLFNPMNLWLILWLIRRYGSVAAPPK